MLLLLILQGLLISGTLAFNCNDFKEGTCPLDEYNLISYHDDVSSAGLCQSQCSADPNCQYFTWFEGQCFLVKGCESIETCQHCVCGPASPAFESCSWPPVPDCQENFHEAYCPLTEMNILEIVPMVFSADECQDKCRGSTLGCKFWTWTNNQCYTLLTCDTLTDCNSCISGGLEPDYDECMSGSTSEPGSTTTTAKPTAGPTTTASWTDCSDFHEGMCPITEYNLITYISHVPSASVCQDKCRDEATGQCGYFTYFDGTCYLLKTCDSIDVCTGCVSGPVSPDIDNCNGVSTTPQPATTTTPRPTTTPVPTTTPAPTTSTTTARPTTTPAPTTQAPTTTTQAPTTKTTTTQAPTTKTTTTHKPTTESGGCNKFHRNYLCQRHNNDIQQIEWIQTASECQALCQEREACHFFSHYVEERGDHKGHCFLHWTCDWLEPSKCRTALRTCPVPNPGGYGDSAEQGNHAAEELDEFTDVEKEGSFEEYDGVGISGSGECGCIAGPKWPDIDTCDV